MHPRAVAVACALIAFVVAGNADAAVIYSEDFEDVKSDGLVVRNGSWRLKPGLNGSTTGLRARSAGHNVVELNFPGDSSDDVRLELDVRLEGKSGFFGVQLNAEVDEGGVTPHDGYEAILLKLPTPEKMEQLKGDKKKKFKPFKDTLRRFADHAGAELSNFESMLKTDETHHVTVERMGDEIVVYVGDKWWLRATDDTFHGGSIALHFYEQGTIDNVTVNKVPEPGAMALGSVVVGMLMRRRRA